MNDELYHYGIRGMKWGVRRYQNSDGSLTPQGQVRYSKMRARDVRNFYKLNGSLDKYTKLLKTGKIQKPKNDEFTKGLFDLLDFYSKESDKWNTDPFNYDRYGHSKSEFRQGIRSIANEYADVSLDYIRTSAKSKERILEGKAFVESALMIHNSMYPPL